MRTKIEWLNWFNCVQSIGTKFCLKITFSCYLHTDVGGRKRHKQEKIHWMIWNCITPSIFFFFRFNNFLLYNWQKLIEFEGNSTLFRVQFSVWLVDDNQFSSLNIFRNKQNSIARHDIHVRNILKRK